MSVNLTIVHRSEMPLIEYSTQVVTDAGEARWPIYLHAYCISCYRFVLYKSPS